jgi:tRNA U34 5-methylaminomethyl-2-thiouridine-forming methyltransferase MnmC
MQRVPLLTKDGSHTISIPEMGVTYHSTYGAIQESLHVFIEAGLKYYVLKNKIENISILEMGFGTGLNALLTAIEAEKINAAIYYVSLEAFPLEAEVATSLNYCQILDRTDLQEDFIRLHECEWNIGLAFSENMLVHKSNKLLQEFEHKTKFHIIYFDAFDPATQPELWTKEVFDKFYSLLMPGGVLVTYCCKGDVRRAMKAAGFTVTKIPGPPGKREMLRAEKINC